MSAENMAPNIVQIIRSAVDRLPDSEAAQLDEASKTVYALVEALIRLRGEWQYQCEIGNVPDGRIEIDRVDAALRAAGVVV